MNLNACERGIYKRQREFGVGQTDNNKKETERVSEDWGRLSQDNCEKGLQIGYVKDRFRTLIELLLFFDVCRLEQPFEVIVSGF